MVLHFAKHFAPGKCSNCNQQLIEIRDKIYHLQLSMKCGSGASRDAGELRQDRKLNAIFIKSEPIVEELVTSVSAESTNDFEVSMSDIPASSDLLQIKLEVDSDDDPIESVAPIVHAADVEPPRRRIARTFQCYICKENRENLPILIRHVRGHFEQSLECETCGMTCPSQSDKISHEKKHTIERAYQCAFCGRRFRRSDNYKQHLNIHTRALQFTCNICHRSFNRKRGLENHAKTHHYEQMEHGDPDISIFICSVCGASFNRKKTLRGHLRTHARAESTQSNETADKNRTDKQTGFRCSYCGHCFRRSDNLKTHLNIHTGSTKYVCSICGRSFNRRYALKMHRRKHGIENESIQTLEAMTFEGSSQPKQQCLPRVESYLQNENGEYVCSACNKTYRKKSSLKNHYAMHSGMQFKCDICDKVFYRDSTLKMHLKMHQETGEGGDQLNAATLAKSQNGVEPRIWECYVCHRILNHLPNLGRHIRHHYERSLTCEICGITCKTWATIRHHRTIHTESYQFICSYCGKGFRHQNNLTRHIFAHTGI